MFNFMFGRPPVPFPEGVEVLDTQTAKEAIKAGEFKLLVDVREPEEWAKGRIPGAIHAPFKEFGAHMEKLREHKDDNILLYCRTQNRSKSIARLLKERGFTKLNILNGGFSGWTEKGYPQEI